MVFLAFGVILICISVFLLYQKRREHAVSSRAAKQQVVLDLVKKGFTEIFKTGTRSTKGFFAKNLESSTPETVVSEIVKQTEKFLRTPYCETITDNVCFDTFEAAETVVIKLLALLTGPDKTDEAGTQALSMIFPKLDEHIQLLQQAQEKLQSFFSDLEKETKNIMQQESPPKKSLCLLRDRYLKCGLTVPAELHKSIEEMKESERQAKDVSVLTDKTFQIENSLQLLDKDQSHAIVPSVTTAMSELKSKVEHMVQYGMPEEEAWRAAREEFAQDKQLAISRQEDNRKFLRKVWLAAENQKASLQIAKRNNIAMRVCFQTQIDAMHDIAEKKMEWKEKVIEDERAARAKEIAVAQALQQMEERRLETSSVLYFLLYLDALIVLLQQAILLWHVVGPEMFSFRCEQRTESRSFMSYIIGDTFRFSRLLCYAGQYGYIGMMVTLSLVAYVIVAKLMSKGAGAPVALGVLVYPFKSHMLRLWYRVPLLLPCPFSKCLMFICINLVEYYKLSSLSHIDIRSLILYVIFPLVSVSCAVACSFVFSSDTPWSCFIDVVHTYRGQGNGLFRCEIEADVGEL